MILRYSYLLKESLWSDSTKKYLLGQISGYLLLLTLDVILVFWYEHFYDSIIVGDWTKFSTQVAIFCCIISLQAIAFGLIANLSELMDVAIKIKLVDMKLSQWNEKNSDILEQRLIEDSLLVADKLSNLTPSIFFAIIKVFVFSIILIWHSEILQISGFNIESSYVLLTGFAITTVIQVFFANKGKKVIEKSEDIKRKGEFEFRNNIRNHISKGNFKKFSNKYIKLIKSIRKICAKKIGSITFLISFSNSISFVIPFIILFQLHEQGVHSLGEIMKIAAIYSALSNSTLQIFNTYREFFRLNAAIQRLLKD